MKQKSDSQISDAIKFMLCWQSACKCTLWRSTTKCNQKNLVE